MKRTKTNIQLQLLGQKRRKRNPIFGSDEQISDSRMSNFGKAPSISSAILSRVRKKGTKFVGGNTVACAKMDAVGVTVAKLISTQKQFTKK